jgi:spore maturation protein CgeB
VKLVVFGLSISSSWGNGQATTWRALARGLADAGHELVFFERDVSYYASHRDLTSIPRGRLHLYSSFADVLPTVHRELASADAAMVTSYCPDGPEAAERVLESRASVRAFYDMDAPVTLSRLRRGEVVDYLPRGGLGDFDVVLSFIGGRMLGELARHLGARRVEPLYGCVDPGIHRPADRGAADADLSYLGTYSVDRQAALEALLFEPARALPEQRFVVGGPLYPAELAWPSNVRHVDHVPPGRHAAFYGASRLTLNVTRGPMKASGFCPSARLFEAAACGVAILSDSWRGLDAFFEPGHEILVASETAEAIDFLKVDPETLARVGNAARARVLDQHTGAHRARELVSILERASHRGPASATLDRHGPPA